MDRVVVDTNVIVSALIGKGNPRRVLELLFSGKVTLCFSTAILDEYIDVLHRPKFSRFPDFLAYASLTLKSLQSIAEFMEPKITLRVCPDPDDNKFLELAVATQARYLITGNKRHFPVGLFKGTQTVSPREFISSFK